MDPSSVSPEQWDQIGRAMLCLYACVGLALTAGLAFLLAHAILPSLAATGDAPVEVEGYRHVLYPVAAVALLGTLFALARALVLGVGVLQYVFPRWGI